MPEPLLCLPFAWQNNEAVLVSFTPNSVSSVFEIRFGNGAQSFGNMVSISRERSLVEVLLWLSGNESDSYP